MRQTWCNLEAKCCTAEFPHSAQCAPFYQSVLQNCLILFAFKRYFRQSQPLIQSFNPALADSIGIEEKSRTPAQTILRNIY
jgi:hypothetical protein